MGKYVYVLHEYGAPNHYNALVQLGKEKGFEVKFFIFMPLMILRKVYRREFKQAINSICFLLSLPFGNKKKIVIGIAPYNSLLPFLSKLLKRHTVFYHTSYTHWDGSLMAYPTKSEKLKDQWLRFLTTQVKHIFAVSKKTKSELISYGYSTSNRISVVNHSFDELIKNGPKKKNLNFIFVGRIIKEKGIEELLTIFENRPNANLTIVGSGPLENLVIEKTKQCRNIKYEGYIKGLKKLIPYYKNNSFVIMNSQRSSTWEELFGLAIIEGMACGCVPITTDHPGPKEIITSGRNGIIVPEKMIDKAIDQAINMSPEKYDLMRLDAIRIGQNYHSKTISSKWNEILDSTEN